MVHFYVSTWLGHGIPRYFVKDYSGYVCECFGMSLTFKLIEWEEQVALPSVGVPHPIGWRPEWNQKADPSPK